MMMAMASEKTRKPSSDAQDWKIVLELHISYTYASLYTCSV